MAIITHAEFHFNRLMLTLIFGIWASEPPSPGPGKRLKRAGLIGLNSIDHCWPLSIVITDDFTEGDLIQFWEFFTMIPRKLKDFER